MRRRRFVAAGCAGRTCGARSTAAATSSTPNPRSGLHAPLPEAVFFRMPPTCAAVSEGFAAHTSAAAPATSGVENDVPLENPYTPDVEPGSGAGDQSEYPERAPKTVSPGAASET